MPSQPDPHYLCTFLLDHPFKWASTTQPLKATCIPKGWMLTTRISVNVVSNTQKGSKRNMSSWEFKKGVCGGVGLVLRYKESPTTGGPVVAWVVSDSVRPHRQQPTRLPCPGILHAITLEWVAISFFYAWKWKVKVKSLSHVQLFVIPWTAAHQAPPSPGTTWDVPGKSTGVGCHCLLQYLLLWYI